MMALVTCVRLFAQAPARVPDLDSPNPGNSWFYYENRGQIIDKGQNIRNDIKYYTDHPGVKIYLGSDTISFTGHSRAKAADSLIVDSSFRLDMQFFCPNRDANQPCNNTIVVYEPSSDSLNYYLPHCGSGGVEGVPGYAGVVYQNAFPNTDVHFFSNPDGPMTYFVFHPSSDTNNFTLLFHGQDSIQSVSNYLHAYIGHHDIWFPDGVAYQVDPFGSILPLTWTPTWYKVDDHTVKMIFGSYNPAFDLIIRTGTVGLKTAAASGTDNLVWTTYYGSNGNEAFPDSSRRWSIDGMPIIRSAPNSPYIWHAMTTSSDSFDINTGSFWQAKSGLDSTFAGSYDCLVSQFDGRTGHRQWATYFGGSNYEEVGAMLIMDANLGNNNTLGNLLLGGRTRSNDLDTGFWFVPWHKLTNIPTGSGTGVFGNTGSFLASFGGSNGRLKYSTYFGGGSNCYMDCLAWDNAKQEIVFSGYIASSNWALVDTIDKRPNGNTISLRKNGRYYQSTSPDKESAFIGAFSLTRDLVWCTLISGDSTDVINVVVPDKSGGLYALGNTCSHSGGVSPSTTPLFAPNTTPNTLPFVNPGSGAFFQTSIKHPYRRGIIAHFNSARAVDWSTLYGGGTDNEYLGLDVNSKNEMYIAGMAIAADTIRSNQADNSNITFRIPAYDAIGSSYMQGYGSNSFGNIGPDAVIARFDSTHHLRWSTLFGQWGTERAPMRLAIDSFDNVFMSGNNEIDDMGDHTGLQGIPIFAVTGRYRQDSNASDSVVIAPIGTLNNKLESSDGWIVQFDPNNHPIWSTMFGGQFPGNHPISGGRYSTYDTIGDYQDAREIISSIVALTYQDTTRLYMTGVTKNPNTPMKFNNLMRRVKDTSALNGSFDDRVHSGYWDCFIGMFDTIKIKPKTVSINNTSNSNAKKNVTVSPNPSHERFTITFNNESESNRVPMVVTSALGQILLSGSINAAHGTNKFMLDLGQLPAGVYFLHIASFEGVRMVKY